VNDERVEEVAATEGDDEDKQEEGIYFIFVINTRINHFIKWKADASCSTICNREIGTFFFFSKPAQFLFFPLSDRWAGQFILELG
jgi:hypothetical protein